MPTLEQFAKGRESRIFFDFSELGQGGKCSLRKK
jgi:hypothetical protein